MFSKLFSFRLMTTLATVFFFGACTMLPPPQPTGILYQMMPGYTATIQGRAGNEKVIGIQVRVPQYCAGRLINLRAEYRTGQIYGATRIYHGIHFDYELAADGHNPWPEDWQASPSSEWRPIVRQWFMPFDMRSAWIRVGLQSVGGSMWVRDLIITC
jgi:hypothetical protein